MIGTGHWGRNFVRVLQQVPGAELLGIADQDEKVLRDIGQANPGLELWSPGQLLDDPDVELDAVVVATPACSHAAIVDKALDHGWDLLVEKPFTTDGDEAERLARRADEVGAVVLLGHTFLFNPAVQRMKALYDEGAVGEAYYLHARRTHLGLIRDDVNAVWDLAPHDVAIMLHLLEDRVDTVSAVGGSYLRPSREDVAFVTIKFASGVIGNVFVSWADSHKVREVQLVGSLGRLVFDDLEALERVKVYEKGIASNVDPDGYGEYQVSLRDGDIYSPNVPAREPLRVEVEHFLDCVTRRARPSSDGWNGVEVVRVLEAIDRSMASGGAPVEVPAINRIPVVSAS